MTETVAGSPVWKPAPHRVPAPGLPTAVRVYEVGPRDGLQAETKVIPTETKVEFIERLVAAGLRTVELTSFVSPRWIPQLADAADLMSRLNLPDSVRTVVLVPNLTGLERALAAGATEVAVFVSATEEFVYASLTAGITEFDSAAGGLGRCPYAKGATGNLATEDLVWTRFSVRVGWGSQIFCGRCPALRPYDPSRFCREGS
ncbi:hypothetical protein [Rhodococcus sp. OK302]|uniref:hypothetical protein n=1 Tax=Rhodococcus sp. OK302 TaxID=1882769 RepID=UPI000B9F5110|nr:hypothetical protein [Rhodococcus sp. OK302]OYD70732.1 HMGL-like protein [Rhodococcus sp. OK302]